MKTIGNFTFFWGKDDPLSNWHPAPFEYKGKTFAQTEQFMMYCKASLFGDTSMAEKILGETNPKINKSQGREVSGFDKSIWNEKCRNYVYIGNREKFRQNQHLLDALLATGETILVEASPYDKIWGIGMTSSDPRATDPNLWLGTNWLGEVLMRVRSELSREYRRTAEREPNFDR